MPSRSQWCNLLDHPSKKCFLCKLCDLSYCSWVLDAIGTFVVHSLFGATPPRCSLHNFHIPWVNFPLLEPQVNSLELAPLHWSFRRAPGILADSHLFPAERETTDFHFQMQDPILGPHALGVGSRSGIETQTLQVGLLPMKYLSRFSVATCGHKVQPSLSLHPSYQSLGKFFYKYLEILYLVSCPSGGHSGWLLYNVALNPFWCQEEMSVASIYSVAILKSDTIKVCFKSYLLKKFENNICNKFLFKAMHTYVCITMSWNKHQDLNDNYSEW